MAYKCSTFSIDSLLATSPSKQENNRDKSPTGNFPRVRNSVNVSSAINNDSHSHRIVKPICINRKKDSISQGNFCRNKSCFKPNHCCCGDYATNRDACSKSELAREIYPSYCKKCYGMSCSVSLEDITLSTEGNSCESNNFSKNCICCQKIQCSYCTTEHDRNKSTCATLPFDHRATAYFTMDNNDRYSSFSRDTFGDGISVRGACSGCKQPSIESPKQKTPNEEKLEWMVNPRPFYKKENKRNQTISESKRDRTTFSKRQRSELENQFQLSRYPSRYHRSQIARYLDLTEFQVKVWFQNRRMKYKRWSSALNHANEFIPSCYCSHVWHK